LSFPSNFAQLAGSSTIIPIPDANAIPWQYAAQNITAADTVDMLDDYVPGVYKSSPDNSKTPCGCETNGLASLTCGTRILQGTPLFNDYGQCDRFEETMVEPSPCLVCGTSSVCL
jgi:hypothetical protein